MASDPTALKHIWLLGHQPYQRLYLKFWLMTSAVYALFVVLGALGGHFGYINEQRSHFLRILIPVCLLAFYVALRSGWSRRLSDPSMTASQMAFAILMLGLAYLVVPEVRGVFLMILPLVLLFGAFTLPPARCRQLGWFAVVVLGLAMAASVWVEWGNATLRVDRIIFLVSSVVLPIAAAMAGRLSAMRSQLRTQKRDLKDALDKNILLAKQDSLTGLPNRRHVLELMAYEEKRVQRQPGVTCICLLDIDNFKRINDTFGHATGDDVLRVFAQASVACLRTVDVLARWGGEEFLLLMPDTSLAVGTVVIERLRNHMARADVWQSLPHGKVTFSTGIAEHRLPEAMQATVSRADAGLYKAKSQGRNCTVAA